MSNDFSALFAPDKDARKVYILRRIGIPALLILSFYVVLLICMYALMTRRRLKRLRRSNTPEFDVSKRLGDDSNPKPENEDLNSLTTSSEGGASFDENCESSVDEVSKAEEGTRNMKTTCAVGTKPFTSRRIVRLLCGAIFFFLSMVAVLNGVSTLQGAIDSMHSSSTNAYILSNHTQFLMTEQVAKMKNLSTGIQAVLRNELIKMNNPHYEYCPSDPTLQDSAYGIAMENQARVVILQLMEFDTYFHLIDGNGGLITNILDTVVRVSDRMARETGCVNLIGFGTLMITSPFFFVPILIIATTLLGFARNSSGSPTRQPFGWRLFQFFEYRILTPLVFLVVSMCWIVAAIVAGIWAANSDLCLTKTAYFQPTNHSIAWSGFELTIFNSLARLGQPPDGLAFQTAEYYFTECSSEPSPLEPLFDMGTSIVRMMVLWPLVNHS